MPGKKKAGGGKAGGGGDLMTQLKSAVALGGGKQFIAILPYHCRRIKESQFER